MEIPTHLTLAAEQAHVQREDNAFVNWSVRRSPVTNKAVTWECTMRRKPGRHEAVAYEAYRDAIEKMLGAASPNLVFKKESVPHEPLSPP